MRSKTIQNWIFRASVAFLIIFAITMSPAEANNKYKTSKTTLDVNLTSYHTKTRGLNENNFGLGLTKHLNHHWNISGGFYENSYNKTSKYLFIGVKHDQHNWRFGVDVGFVTGYNEINDKSSSTTCTYINKHDDDEDDDISHSKYCNTITDTKTNLDEFQFVVLPYISYLYDKNHALKFSFIPPVTNKSELVITAQYQFGGFDFLQ